MSEVRPVQGQEVFVAIDHKVEFHVGQTEDGKYLAASSVTPIFCFCADSEDAVIAKADRAIRFFYSSEGKAFDAPVSQTKRVISFVPQRRIEVELEAA
jgi:hypothetical protein